MDTTPDIDPRDQGYETNGQTDGRNFLQVFPEKSWFGPDYGSDFEATVFTCAPFTPEIRDGVAHIDLRFVSRNSKSKKSRTMFGIAYYPGNAWVGAVKTRGAHVDGEPYRIILDMILRDSQVAQKAHHLDITLALREADRNAFITYLSETYACDRDALLDGVASSDLLSLRVLSGEEASPAPHQIVNPLETMFINDEKLTGRSMEQPFRDMLSKLEAEQSFLPEEIDDLLSRDQEIRVVDDPDLSSPSTAVIGLSGSGKSSLISSLTGLKSFNIPPAGASRTTLSPISFINSSRGHFTLHVDLMPRKKVVSRVRQRIEAALLHCFRIGAKSIAMNSEPLRTLLRSDDSTFDMRLIFGRVTQGGVMTEEWTFILDQVNEVFGMILSSEPDDEDEVLESDMPLMLAILITDLIAESIERLTFGRLGRNRNDMDGGTFFPQRFIYGSEDIDAVISVFRRFTSVNPKHAGKSFSPVVSHVYLDGPLVDRTGPFRLIDGRGFDHEGDLEQMAGQDVLDTIDEADRIVIVESAMKVGDRATMGLVAQIVSSGASEKVFFAQTKVDELTSRAVEPESHIRNGLLNGLNGVAAVAGHNAVQQIRENMDKAGVFSFASLHEMNVEIGKGLSGTDGTSDLEHESHINARRLLDLAVRPGDAGHEHVSILEAGPVYKEKTLEKAVEKGLSSVREKGVAHYGACGQNAGWGLSWNRIKWEVRHMLRFFREAEKDAPPIEILYLTAIFYSEVMKHVSGCLDRPTSWNEAAQARASNPLEYRNNVTNIIRSRIFREFHMKTIDLVIHDLWDQWVAADKLSMESFGPNSTYERTRRINSILDCLEGSSRDVTRLIAGDIEAIGATIQKPQEI